MNLWWSGRFSSNLWALTHDTNLTWTWRKSGRNSRLLCTKVKNNIVTPPPLSKRDQGSISLDSHLLTVCNGLSRLYRRPGLCFCRRCWVSQSFLLTEMSPGLLGIKTRPQLSEISLSAAHPPSRTHTEAHRHTDMHTPCHATVRDPVCMSA